MSTVEDSRRGQLGLRLRQTIRRRAGTRVEITAEPLTVPAAPGAGLVDNDEAAELESAVAALHDLYLLTLDGPVQGAGVKAKLMRRVRGLAYRVLRLLVAQQTSYNGATARAMSALRNQAIRHERLLMDLRLAIGEHAGALLEQERVVRILEQQDRLAGSEALDVDRLALARAFRGDEDSVRERQARYLAHFEGASSVLDIGCGRGEFLELLRDAGIDARGVDEDGHAVEHCRAKGLDVIRRNGISVLEESTDGSLGGIFAAQVIEHLPPSALLRLVRQARRALAPGGVLLLESVNPETLLNFAEFYIDPTHIRPYHPRLLLWLFEQEGFVDVQADSSVDPDPTFKLPPLSSAGLDAPEFDAALDRLNALLYGRLAYAVIGRAPASAA